MAKNKNLKKLMSIFSWIIMIVTSLFIGGSFVAGNALSLPLLSYLPLIVHQIIGWGIIGLAIVGAILAILKK